MENKFKQVINADGRMTILGVSRISQKVAKAMEFAGSNFFVMSEYKESINNEISNIIQSANVCVVNSASAGISLSIAAAIYKDRIYDVNKNIPEQNEIVLAKGHNIDFGAPIENLLNLVGAKIVEVGYANRCSSHDYKYNINKNTAAILYVVSHHCVQKNMVSLDEIIEIAKANKVPLIVDCAAEEDILKYSKKEIDVVIFSGSKALEGPTSGLVFGKNKEIIVNIQKHSLIIGRVMKVGKENIFGLLQALRDYKIDKEIDFKSYFQIFENNSSLNCSEDIDGRGIRRIRIKLKNSKLTAKELSKKLKEGNPAIYLRDYFASQGYLDIDLRNITLDQANIINENINIIMKG